VIPASITGQTSAFLGRRARFGMMSLTRALLLTVSLANFCAAQTTPPASSLDECASESSSAAETPQLHEIITVNENEDRSSTDFFTDLIDTANKRDSRVQESVAEVNKYGAKLFLIKSQASDALNFIFMHKGVSVSSEAGDVILDEKIKMNGLGAARLLHEKVRDELELQVIASTLQLATAVGSSDMSTTEADTATTQLANLVGDEAANRAKTAFSNQSAAMLAPPSGNIWNVPQLQRRIQAAVEAAAMNDRICSEVRDDVHRYNTHTSAMLGVHRIVQTALCITSLSPNVIGPASQALLFGYVLMTGGSEQNKLLKELYMDKRLECRAIALREEAHLAFDNYHLGILTKNKALTAASQQLLAKLTSPTLAQQLLNSPDCPVIAVQTVEQVLEQDCPETGKQKKLFAGRKTVSVKGAPRKISEKVESGAKSLPTTETEVSTEVEQASGHPTE